MSSEAMGTRVVPELNPSPGARPVVPSESQRLAIEAAPALPFAGEPSGSLRWRAPKRADHALEDVVPVDDSPRAELGKRKQR